MNLENDFADVAGAIYILTNPSFPEYVKIGYADDLRAKLNELNRSECIPFPFSVYAIYLVTERFNDAVIHGMIENINQNVRSIDSFDWNNKKKEFYKMTATDAYDILKTIATISGTIERLHKITPNNQDLIDKITLNKYEIDTENAEEKNNGVANREEQTPNKRYIVNPKIPYEKNKVAIYTEDQLLEKADIEIIDLYHVLRNRLTQMNGVSVKTNKLTVAFKAPNKNFVDVEVQKHALKLIINMRKGTLIDPKNITEDISNVGHWGTGDYRIYFYPDSDFEYVMGLIKQSYVKNGGRINLSETQLNSLLKALRDLDSENVYIDINDILGIVQGENITKTMDKMVNMGLLSYYKESRTQFIVEDYDLLFDMIENTWKYSG